MTLPASLWPEVSSGFDEASALPRDERTAWLARARTERPEVAAHVERLLAAHDRPVTADPLAAGPGDLVASALAAQLQGSRPGLEAGRMVGPYRLVTPLGEGGMASVWLAEQTQNVQRRVALKIPHHGLEDAAAAAARYARERDVLAGLEHSHIARLYDAGVSADGLPYLAMEWIDGVTLCHYADERRLDLAARIALFRQVLQAVRFAHARLVIHRDLKPSNILVTADGQVKLLDFGIARLIEGDLAADDGEAGAEARALTPECASPEQLAGASLGTPSDVYSLGVVLYELLCGQRPYRLAVDGPRDARAWHEALMRAVVVPPSRTLLDDEAATVRHSTPRALRRRLAGDLDAVVLKALQKDAADRYDSAESFDAELARWQEGRAVLARRATLPYLAGRYLWRHRVIVAGALAVALALAVGLGVSASALVSLALAVGLGAALWQARQARRQARASQAVQAFLLSLFTASDPEQARGKDISARELLDRGAQRLDSELQDQPVVLARLHHAIGGIYIQLGSNVSAQRHLEKALALFRAQGLEGSEDGIEALFNLVEVLDEESQFDEAGAAAERCLALAQRHFGPHHRWKLLLQKHLAWRETELGRPQAAVEAMQQALTDADRIDPRPSVAKAKARNVLANAWMDLGQFAAARDEFARILRDHIGVPGYELTDRLVDRQNLARARFNLRDFAAAADELAVLVSEMDAHIGPRHDRTIKARALWAQALAELGHYGQAIDVQHQNLGHAQAREATDEEMLNLQRLTLAKLYKLAARPRDGLPLLHEGLAFFDAKHVEPYWLSEIARRLLGELLLQDGQVDAALDALSVAEARSTLIEGHATHTNFADLLQAKAFALHVRSQGDDAEQADAAIAQAQAIYQQALGADNPATLRADLLRGWWQVLASPPAADRSEAFEVAAERYAATLPQGHVARAELQLMRAEVARHRGDATAAQALEATGRSAWRVPMDHEFRPPLVTLH
jgi:serine/threonine protein kinase